MRNSLFFLFALIFVACSSGSSTSENNSKNGEKNGSMTDSRDGQTYKTVKIGDQVWMAQNLNYETANSYCYNDNATNCTKYGRLYTMTAAKSACPSGWHLPTQTEWNTLFTTVGGQSVAGTKLKSTSGWCENGNGTDAFSFSALPAGERNYDGSFIPEDSFASFWGFAEDDGYGAYCMHLSFSSDGVDLSFDGKDNGYSVRCLKD